MIELNLVIHDQEAIPGAGPGGTVKTMQKVTMNGETVGFIAYQQYQREGGVFEAYMPDRSSLLMRDRSAEVLALELASRRARNTAARNSPLMSA